MAKNSLVAFIVFLFYFYKFCFWPSFNIGSNTKNVYRIMSNIYEECRISYKDEVGTWVHRGGSGWEGE